MVKKITLKFGSKLISSVLGYEGGALSNINNALSGLLTSVRNPFNSEIKLFLNQSKKWDVDFHALLHT